MIQAFENLQYENNRVFWSGDLPHGIYRVSAIFDASRMDWDKFHINLELFNNKGRRTGPWDFDFNNARPLVPAWWLSVNGARLGIAMAQRPSVSETQNKLLRMTFGFEVEEDGPAQLELEPLNESDVSALQFRLEPEVDDCSVALKLAKSLQESNYARSQITTGELATWANKLKTTHVHYQLLFDKALTFAKESSLSEMLPLLAFAARTQSDGEASALLRDRVVALLELEHWGNQDPAGYGHDADMGVAAILEPLSFVYHWGNFDDELREKLRIKLQLQMQRFYTQLLLWRGFWGGSISQDHGHRSVCRFGVAAINLLGEIPDAQKWLNFTAQRMDRVLAALAPDGAVPFSSYHKVHLYMDDMTTWRDALLHATGRDIFDGELFPKIISFVTNRLYEPACEVLCASPRGDRKDFYAGWGFFNAIAEKHDDQDAARLSEILRERYMHRFMPNQPASHLLQALAHDNGIQPQPLQPAIFDCRFDTGLANYRPRREVQVALRCASPGSLHSYYRASGPCDRIKDAPLEGHFTVSIGRQTLLLTAEGGYRMRSSLGCVLLIDGKGGYGDDDYAMGIPGITFRGEQIETAWCDEAKQEAYMRMNLAAAYPREAKVLSYYREFFLRPDGMMCRDVLSSTLPHKYSWNFQTYARRNIEAVGESTFHISDGDAALTLRGECLETTLHCIIGDTEVVWAYDNENQSQPFRHIKYFTEAESTFIMAEFTVCWE